MLCNSLEYTEAGEKLNIYVNTHMASGRLASQQHSPRSASKTAYLMQHHQPLVDHLHTC